MNIKGMVLLLIMLPMVSLGSTAQPLSIAEVGRKLFFDPNLSEPAGQSCASCHVSTAGFADPDREIPVSRGIHPDRFGPRNTPSIAYSMFSPALYYDNSEQHYVGGQFYDGRAKTLEDQAKEPFLDRVEMANPDSAAVVRKVRAADYADEFLQVFGKDGLADIDKAFNNIAVAIAAFERTPAFRPFTSKYDYYLAGEVTLTESEMRGLRLFEAEDKGNCAACHPSQADDKGNPPLFTDYTYDNLGLPANEKNPFYAQSAEFNPEGRGYIDVGLAATTGRDEDRGKFKVTTLRNIALTAPYFHNGIVSSLTETVQFYNTRDTRQDWGRPEVSENVNTDELGDLGLTEAEVADIVAFMETLTDGYLPR